MNWRAWLAPRDVTMVKSPASYFTNLPMRGSAARDAVVASAPQRSDGQPRMLDVHVPSVGDASYSAATSSTNYSMNPHRRALIEMHVCVVLWGFTAILGKLITLPALQLVWWRMLLVSAGAGVLPARVARAGARSRRGSMRPCSPASAAWWRCTGWRSTAR